MSAPLSFVDFVMSCRVTPTARGALIDFVQTRFKANALPVIASWPGLYHFVKRRDASHEAIMRWRMLWAEYKAAADLARYRNPLKQSAPSRAPEETSHEQTA
ncbi:hypothetical protein [Bradyrhizobium sp. USDA 4508]